MSFHLEIQTWFEKTLLIPPTHDQACVCWCFQSSGCGEDFGLVCFNAVLLWSWSALWTWKFKSRTFDCKALYEDVSCVESGSEDLITVIIIQLFLFQNNKPEWEMLLVWCVVYRLQLLLHISLLYLHPVQ